jgi:hemerythrin
MLITQELLPKIELSRMNKIHDEEIALITKLHTAAKNTESTVVFELLDELIKHTAKHFSDEEKLMKESAYPEYPMHQHEHAKQLLDLQAIRSFLEMTHDTHSIPDYLEGTLTPWIIEHVENHDSILSEFLIRKP